MNIRLQSYGKSKENEKYAIFIEIYFAITKNRCNFASL